MQKIIGIYKELREGEEVLSETPDFVKVDSANNPFGTDFFDAKLYLTNRRLIFLIATTLDIEKAKAKKLVATEESSAGEKIFSFLDKINKGEDKADSSVIVSSWMEIPLGSIRNIDTPSGFFSQKKNQLILEFSAENKGLLGLFKETPKVALHLDNRDMWKTVIHNAMQEHKTEQKSALGIKVDDRGRNICALCGTKYAPDEAKIVQCGSCNRHVCREKKQGGLFSKNWVKTECWAHSDFMCAACAKKAHG